MWGIGREGKGVISQKVIPNGLLSIHVRHIITAYISINMYPLLTIDHII